MTLYSNIISAIFMLSLFVLSACSNQGSLYDRSLSFDVSNFDTLETVTLDAREIVIVNEYAAHKYLGDYSEYFAVNAHEAFEDYIKKRFVASGQGDTVFLVIDKASLIHVRESLGGSNDDNVYTLDFKVQVLEGNDLETAEVVNTVQVVQSLRQRLDIISNKQMESAQFNFLARTIALFDKRFLLSQPK